MTCDEYRARHARTTYPLPREVWDTPEHEAWTAHYHDCAECRAWDLVQQVRARGADPARYPCIHMAYHATHTCRDHPDPWDCPDQLVHHRPEPDEYGLPVRDGGTAMSVIRFCPWCGVELPPSRRPDRDG